LNFQLSPQEIGSSNLSFWLQNY